MRRDLRGPLLPGETQEQRTQAILAAQPAAYAWFLVSLIVVVLASIGGVAGFFWALGKYGGDPVTKVDR